MAEQDKIDKLLDRALGEYGATSARAGLEGRLLARLEAEPDRNRSWLWWIVVPAMAALAVIAVLVAWRPQSKVNIANVTPVRVGVPPAPPSTTEAPRRDWVVKQPSRPPHPKAPVKANPKRRDSEPRLATFPSQDSNDQLVRLAMQFVKAHPDEATEIVREQKEFREVAAQFTAPLKEEE